MNSRRSLSMLVVAAAAVGLLLASCSELKNTLPPVAPEQKAHPAGWGTSGDTTVFHGSALERSNYETDACKKCHGATLAGGMSGVACAKCHGTSYPHGSGWSTSGTTGFHGTYLKAKNYNATECQACHGADYRGEGDADKSCYKCHGSYPHTATWLNASSGSSHGQYVKTKSWNLTECASCHGSSYTGGTSGQSCFTCHPSYPHASNIESAHPAALRAANYPFDQCKVCHGNSYAGGTIANISCMTSGCHQDASGTAKSPEACNTCHGNFRGTAADTTSWAPSSGAHAKHVSATTVGAAVKCQECHVVPATLTAAGHLGTDGHAEVVLAGPLSRTTSRGGAIVPAPTYNASTGTCNNTYCHGNFAVLRSSVPFSYYQNFYTDSVMVGLNASPAWATASSGACGTCHANAPAGHVASTVTACYSCHQGIMDGTGAFTDKSKHVNGKVEVFSNPSANMR